MGCHRCPQNEERYYFSNIWIYGTLPVAADLSAIANENVRLVPQVVRVEGKPARERLGEWTMNVWTGGGPPRVLKFTLQAAP